MSSDVPPRDPAASELMPCGYCFGYHAEALDVETLWRHRHSSRYSSMHFSPVHVLLTWASFIKREAPARLKIRSFPVPRWYLVAADARLWWGPVTAPSPVFSFSGWYGPPLETFLETLGVRSLLFSPRQLG